MDDKKDKKIIVKLVCVFISFSLWFYVTNVENPNRTVTIRSVPVTIKNANNLKKVGLVLVPNEDYTINIKIEGQANDVYSAKAKDFKLVADLKDYALKKGNNTVPIKVINYPEGIKIKNKDLLSLNLQVEKYEKKEFEVRNNVSYDLKSGYKFKSEVITPSKVTVSGPKSLVDSVSKVALIGTVENVTDRYSGTFQLRAYDENNNEITGVNLSSATAVLTIEANSSKEVNVKVNYSGVLKEGVSIQKTILSKEKVIITGDSETLKSIDYIETQPIDLSYITKSTTVTTNLLIPRGLRCNDSSINVSFEIEDSSSVNKTFDNVSINYIDKNDIFDYDMPDSVSITVIGKNSDIESIKLEDIKVTASLKNITEERENQSVSWSATIDNSNVIIENNTGTVSIKATKKTT